MKVLSCHVSPRGPYGGAVEQIECLWLCQITAWQCHDLFFISIRSFNPTLKFEFYHYIFLIGQIIEVLLNWNFKISSKLVIIGGNSFWSTGRLVLRLFVNLFAGILCVKYLFMTHNQLFSERYLCHLNESASNSIMIRLKHWYFILFYMQITLW